jgi:hypothetical protein
MLVHVTMTHTPDNCPAYHPEMLPAMITSMEKLEEVGRELRVKAHALLWGAPDHVAYAVLEAENLGAIARYLNSVAIVQEFKITPVQNLSEVVQFGKEALAKQKQK